VIKEIAVEDAKNNVTPDSVIVELTLEQLRDLYQQAGYRVETVTDPVANVPLLRSATGGVAFDIRPGNRAAQSEAFVDVALVAVLFVRGELPLEVVNRWNATRRFARLQLSQTLLVLSMDISAAGGVTGTHIRAQIEIWDRLMQELIAYLREEVSKLAPANAVNAVNSALAPETPPAPATRSKNSNATPNGEAAVDAR